MSLKPPWKQKNPIMEKACQTYHRNRAPEENIKLLKKVKATSVEHTLEKEVIGNYSGGSGKWKRECTFVTLNIKDSQGKRPWGFLYIRHMINRGYFTLWISKLGHAPLKVTVLGETVEISEGYSVPGTRLLRIEEEEVG